MTLKLFKKLFTLILVPTRKFKTIMKFYNLATHKISGAFFNILPSYNKYQTQQFKFLVSFCLVIKNMHIIN